jgi:hypothetical protein
LDRETNEEKSGELFKVAIGESLGFRKVLLSAAQGFRTVPRDVGEDIPKSSSV